MSRNFLATFRPLCSTSAGRKAVRQHHLPPFTDGSCRREPDLELEWPSISALCRARNFAPRLRVGDRVAFVTVRGRYDVSAPSCWRLVALLRVALRFETHDEAAAWYTSQGSRLPGACIVTGNDPLPLDRTKGASRKLRLDGATPPEEIVRMWDVAYRRRARTWPMLLACEKQMVDLFDPPRILEEDWLRWNGRVPITQTPPEISNELWDHLESLAA